MIDALVIVMFRIHLILRTPGAFLLHAIVGFLAQNDDLDSPHGFQLAGPCTNWRTESGFRVFIEASSRVVATLSNQYLQSDQYLHIDQ